MIQMGKPIAYLSKALSSKNLSLSVYKKNVSYSISCTKMETLYSR